MAGSGEQDDRTDMDKLDLTEDEFDARFAEGEPVIVVGRDSPAWPPRRVEDYYTLQMSDSTTLASAGRWAVGPRWVSDQDVPLVSHT
jgi:hypothetical protein